MPLALRTSPSFCLFISFFFFSFSPGCFLSLLPETISVTWSRPYTPLKSLWQLTKLNNDVFSLAVKSNGPLPYFPTWPSCFILSIDESLRQPSPLPDTTTLWCMFLLWHLFPGITHRLPFLCQSLMLASFFCVTGYPLIICFDPPLWF